MVDELYWAIFSAICLLRVYLLDLDLTSKSRWLMHARILEVMKRREVETARYAR